MLSEKFYAKEAKQQRLVKYSYPNISETEVRTSSVFQGLHDASIRRKFWRLVTQQSESELLEKIVTKSATRLMNIDNLI